MIDVRRPVTTKEAPPLFEVSDGAGRWLPNLAGGVSIWRLAEELNRPELLDGRLVMPMTDGPESLPVRVVWDVSGLVPLADVRRTRPAEASAAVADFAACLDRTALALGRKGYGHYRDALTLPDLDGESASYFYDPSTGRLRVIHWGARPRAEGAADSRGVSLLRFGALRDRVRRQEAGSASAPGPAERRGRRWWWLLLLGLLLVGGAAFLLASADGEEERSPPPPSRSTDPPATPIEPPASGPPVEPPPPLPVPDQRIHFDVGDDSLGPDQLTYLEAVRAYLAEHPEVRLLLVEGHADLRGREEDNAGLSAERAARVIDWLVARGVEPARLRGAGCSESYPLAPELAANRRVEFRVLDPAPPGGAPLRPGCVALP